MFVILDASESLMMHINLIYLIIEIKVRYNAFVLSMRGLALDPVLHLIL